MTMQRPTAQLALDGGNALTLPQAAVRRLRVDLSVGEGHDRVEIVLWAGSSLAEAQPNAKLAVGIGDGDDVTDVMTAEVAGVDITPWGAVLTAYAPSRKLSGTRIGKSYVDSTVTDVVTDLLDESEVDSGEIDAGLSLPVLHIDPLRPVWQHLHVLARTTGHQITSTPEGAVSFTPIPGATGGGLAAVASALGIIPSGELRRNAELIAFHAGPRPASTTSSVVTPSAGTGAQWHLLAAEPDSGSGPAVLVNPMLRTREAADAAANAYQAAATRGTRTATITVPGRPQLRAGGTVSTLDQSYRVLRVRHVLDADTGYRSDLLLEADQ